MSYDLSMYMGFGQHNMSKEAREWNKREALMGQARQAQAPRTDPWVVGMLRSTFDEILQIKAAVLELKVQVEALRAPEEVAEGDGYLMEHKEQREKLMRILKREPGLGTYTDAFGTPYGSGDSR